MRIASILVLAELIPVESTVLTKSPGSTGVSPQLSLLGGMHAGTFWVQLGMSRVLVIEGEKDSRPTS